MAAHLNPILGLFAYGCAAVFAIGCALRVRAWRRAPEPLPRPIAPACSTHRAARLRIWGDVFFITNRHTMRPGLWLASALAHLCLALLILPHLRWFFAPAPWLLATLGKAGPWLGALLAISLAALLMRRLANARLALISRGGDYLILGLLLAVTLSGLYLAGPGRQDPVAIKSFCRGLLGLAIPGADPVGPWFGLHFALGCLLLALLPFSKLVHFLGFAFIPARRQLDPGYSPAKVNPWAWGLAGDKPSRAAVLPGEPSLYDLEAYEQVLSGAARERGKGELP